MTKEAYIEYKHNLEMVCDMCRTTILYGQNCTSKELVQKARETLKKTEAQLASLAQTYAKYEGVTR